MPVTVKSEYLNVPGGFVNLETYDGGGSGIPLLYVHGGPGGNCESFKPMAVRLIAISRTAAASCALAQSLGR